MKIIYNFKINKNSIVDGLLSDFSLTHLKINRRKTEISKFFNDLK